MGETTSLSTDEDVKQRLQNYYHTDHYSWGDALSGMMAVLPDYDYLQAEGCAQCEWTAGPHDRYEQMAGSLQFFRVPEEHGGGTVVNYFCSDECHSAYLNMAEAAAPRDPDRVVVGGAEEWRVELEDAHFYIDADIMEVSLDVPGAFAGTDEDGEEYQYVGEPVYVEHNGHWPHCGVIEDIIHEESHTALVLESDMQRTRPHHPDESARRDWMERNHAEDLVEEAAEVAGVDSEELTSLDDAVEEDPADAEGG